MEPVIPIAPANVVEVVTIDGKKFYTLIVDTNGHLQVDAVSNALPDGAATDLTLQEISIYLDALQDLRYALHSVNTDELQVNVESTVQPPSPTSVVSGKDTVAAAGTHEQMANVPCLSVTIRALSTNTGLIYLGPDGVSSTTGYQLSAGESVDIAIDNVNRIYIDSSVNGEGVTYLAVN